jgi:hypothetical protein
MIKCKMFEPVLNNFSRAKSFSPWCSARHYMKPKKKGHNATHDPQ